MRGEVAAGPAGQQRIAVELGVGEFVEFAGEERCAPAGLQQGLQEGQLLVTTIEGLGQLKNRVIKEA